MAGVWVWSGWCFLYGRVDLEHGELSWKTWPDQPGRTSNASWLQGVNNRVRWEWWYGIGHQSVHVRNLGLYKGFDLQGATGGSFGGGYTHEVIFWPIPVLLWIPAALLLRSGILARRRASTAQCAKCGYSLAGLGADAACPECGKGAGTT